MSLLQRTTRTLLAIALSVTTLQAAPVTVKHSQGTIHGYMAIRTESGELLGSGDLIQTGRGSRVTIQLLLHFKDGSVDDETTTYSQNGTFRLLSDHHIQKGPFFPKPVDYTIEANGTVTMKTFDKDGKEKVETQHIALPADTYNGMMYPVFNNLSPRSSNNALGMIVPVLGKGRLIKLAVSDAGPQRFTEVGRTETADVFRIHMDLGGIVGFVAPIVGKEPGDIFLWIAQGTAPQFVRLVGPLAEGTPTVSIELSGAVFDHPAAR